MVSPRMVRVRVTLFKVNSVGSKDTANVLGRCCNGGPLLEGNKR